MDFNSCCTVSRLNEPIARGLNAVTPKDRGVFVVAFVQLAEHRLIGAHQDVVSRLKAHGVLNKKQHVISFRLNQNDIKIRIAPFVEVDRVAEACMASDSFGLLSDEAHPEIGDVRAFS